MDVLDKVYTTFANLEDSYKRSRKSRKDFILDKFGGDINIGSMIILDAVSNAGVEDPEDIKKLTFVKGVIEQIKAMQDSLDAVNNFSAFTSSSDATNFLRLLEQSYIDGTGQHAMFQKGFHGRHKKAYHISSSLKGTDYVPLSEVQVVSVFSDHIGNLLPMRWRVEEELHIDDLLEVKGNARLEAISATKADKKLKG